MQETGIIRKIDAIGRVILPCDFREQLGLHPGRKVLVSVNADQEIVIRKKSGNIDLASLADSFAHELYRAIGHTVIVCDDRQVVLAVGENQKDMKGALISESMARLLKTDKTFIFTREEKCYPVKAWPQCALLIVPIQYNKTVCGAIAILEEDSQSLQPIAQSGIELTQYAANMLVQFML